MAAGTPVWSSRFAFIMASVGFAVGLGNIWRFPYVTGENGGGAFVIIYLLCVFAIGVPCVMAELLVGRRGKSSPSKSMAAVAEESGQSRAWGGVGGLGVFTAYTISITYAVVVGWVLWYLIQAAMTGFAGIDAASSVKQFEALQADGSTMLIMTVVGNLIVGGIIYAGVTGGIERAVTVMMPMLFALLVGLSIYNMFAGGFGETLRWLFTPDFSKIDGPVLLAAIGQAFFSIGVGMGGMMTYGSYLPANFSITRGAMMIVLADTLVALLAGFVVFPMVFNYGLDMASGPGLIFQTLPLAFAQMPGGYVFGILFFVMLSVAGITSLVGLLESVTNWTDQRSNLGREMSAVVVIGSVTVCSVASVLSYNVWQDHTLFFGMNFNDASEALYDKITLPLGGLLIALFVGWFMKREYSGSELATNQGTFGIWQLLLRFIAVPAIALILVMGLTDSLSQLTDWFTYVLIVALLAVGLRFSVGASFVQLRLFFEMFRGLAGGFAGKARGLSSFQALVVSVAGRVGAGNIGGVAVAITLGGPGALFWMWIIAILGMATSLFECTLAQLYKRGDTGDTYRGGPAYVMRYGLGWTVMPVIYSALLLVTIGFGFNAVQSFIVTESIEAAFSIPRAYTGALLTGVIALVLLGGIRRLASVAQVIVPIMVLGYFGLAISILVFNFGMIPDAVAMIVRSAFGLEQVVGGGIAAAIMQGARRGLFSNEAGLGTIPNVAATADVKHPISQGLVQSLSVFIDTMILCTCTALIILVSSAYSSPDLSVTGVELTQKAVGEHFGGWGESIISIFIVLFATTTIAYNCFLGENSITYFGKRPAWAVPVFRLSVLAMIGWASLQDLETVFKFSDLTMVLLAITNLMALWHLAPICFRLLKDFESQLKEGRIPVFRRATLPDEQLDPKSWD
jgi:amino acid carrier protein